MDDIILPGGRPAKPRRTARCSPHLGLDLAVAYDGQVTVDGPSEIIELGQGHWKVVNADAWDRLLLIAMQRASEDADPETAEDRLVRRKQQARDRRN